MQALWMLAASLFFASMAVCVKIAGAWYSPAELVFYRGLIGMAVMALWAFGTGLGDERRQRLPADVTWGLDVVARRFVIVGLRCDVVGAERGEA